MKCYLFYSSLNKINYNCTHISLFKSWLSNLVNWKLKCDNLCWTLCGCGNTGFDNWRKDSNWKKRKMYRFDWSTQNELKEMHKLKFHLTSNWCFFNAWFKFDGFNCNLKEKFLLKYPFDLKLIYQINLHTLKFGENFLASCNNAFADIGFRFGAVNEFFQFQDSSYNLQNWLEFASGHMLNSFKYLQLIHKQNWLCSNIHVI